MSNALYPAREYRSGVPLLYMDKGGYQRRTNKRGEIVWFFKLPVDVLPVVPVKDSLVPTIEDLPVITIGHWHLNQKAWIRLPDKV